MTRMLYNWIMRRKLEPREDPEGVIGITNFTGRIKGMHIFVGNFTYISDFKIIEDISSIIDPRLSQVVLGKPFVEISNMTLDLSLGIHTKSVYFRNEEYKRRGVDYVMSKILGFYKECLELGPEYLTGLEDEEGVTFETIGIHAFEWLLEEIHVTWAHLEKKWTRLRLYTKSLEEIIIQTAERRRQLLRIGVKL
ncbi:hypothetical protein Tco_0717921 [Tanacetum coccineum]